MNGCTCYTCMNPIAYQTNVPMLAPTAQNAYAKLKPGKTEYKLVKRQWDDYSATYNYVLLFWDTRTKLWSEKATGKVTWANKQAKHYKLKIEEL